MVLCACRLLTPCRTRFRPQHILILGRAIRRRARPTVGAVLRAWGEGKEISSAAYSHHRVAGRFDGASGGRGLPLGRFSGHGGGGKRFRPQHILIIGWGRCGGARGARALPSGRFCGHGGKGDEISSAAYSHHRVGAIRRRARPTVGAIQRTWGEALSTRH